MPSKHPAEAGANSPEPASSEPTPISAAKPAAPVVAFGGDAVGVDDGKRSAAAEADAEPAKPSGGAEIVSLDKFRKK